jgi:antitoxin VapB
MALSIKSQEADRLARELAQATGESITDAVVAALRERLDRERRRRGARTERFHARLKRIQERVARLPVLDSRAPEEIIGYDRHGLPRS